MNADEILQACVGEVLAGRKTPAECAAAFPNVPDLESQLRAVLALRAAQATTIRPEAGQRIEARLRQRVSELSAPREPVPRRPRPFALNVRWAAALALIVTLLLAGAGTAAAAERSMPGELFYGLKRMDESAQVFFSPDSSRAFVYAGLARRRLDEITVISGRETMDAGVLTGLADDLTTETASALAFVDRAPVDRQADILNTLVQVTAEEQATLVALRATAPPEARAGLDRAIEASGRGHGHAVERLEQILAGHGGADTPTPGGAGHIVSATPAPSTQTRVPPGQADKTESANALSATPPGSHGETHVPPGQTRVPPGQTHIPPGQTHIPPGQTHIPPGQTHMPPGQTKAPSGQVKSPPQSTPDPNRAGH